MKDISLPKTLDQVERFLNKRKIDTSAIAFYNTPEFLAEEQKASSFLEYYAVFVRLRQRDQNYDDHVRAVVPRVVTVVAEQINRDGQKGVCIDASMMLTKMLELHGVWSYAVNGALTIHSPTLQGPTHFWPMDVKPVAGHVWLVAPPFEIVDVSLACQAYFRGEDKLLPQFMISEGGTRITPEATDYCSGEVLRNARQRFGPLPKDIHYRLDPGLKRRVEYFPSYEIISGTTKLHYCAGGVSVSDAPSLEAITSRRWNGLLASELYEQVVKPEIADTDFLAKH